MTDLPRTADVVVIGAGIVGCSAAYHLAAAGAGRVLLLDREDAVGRGSTGACAGGFRQQFSTEVNIRLSRASVPMIVGFTEEHGIALDVTQDGYLFLVREADSWRSFLRGVELQRSLGVEVETLGPDDAAVLVPGVNVEGVIGATFGPRDGIADPAGLTQGYASLARDAGVTVALATSVPAPPTVSESVPELTPAPIAI
jgi:sarcosine oxidase subunit beta